MPEFSEPASTKGNVPIMLIHDEGEPLLMRTAFRKARRYSTAGKAYGPPGSLTRPARLFVEDAVPRHSDQSYFIQLADLNAYAAFRHVKPPTGERVWPGQMWNELGAAVFRPVNSVRGGPPGIVVR